MDFSRVRHVIWDWNGTLLDDVKPTMDSVNQMLVRRGLPPMDFPFYQAVVRFPVVEYYRMLGFDLAEEGFSSMVEDFTATYEAAWRGSTVRPETFAALDLLEARGVVSSVLTASHLGAALEQMEYFGLNGRFARVTGVDNFNGHGKTQLARAHMDACGLSGEETVLIGDSPHDLETARAAGCDCILLSCGHFSALRLALCGVAVAPDALDAARLICRSAE
ncbi:MAG: HAD family hydrolase [Eubacteriales bacterium]|nr:HAD family hydrolase [Eubacteriales bacterium]